MRWQKTNITNKQIMYVVLEKVLSGYRRRKRKLDGRNANRLSLIKKVASEQR